ncbi:MAG: asparagine synthase (glutamine-hydrolyzing) [Acidobacteria bacterium]|nr:asparagine synthase (glutamine-hydrolyzing) [Acidobacteriota bacterium]
MCGIAGAMHFDGAAADRALLSRVISTLKHRGPDDCGVYLDGNVGLAHARLSIIDISGGRQPMQSADGTLSVTFNGEIFNYIELREQLVRKGHQFRTRSDTEVILHLYQEKGEDCVNDFNGQWSFAIWDRVRRKLFLSRDRLGVRPLFFTTADHTFVFASEVKALLAFPGVQREFDLAGLDQIFTFWFTVPPRTIFKNISELAPGHSLTVQDGKIKTKRHWQLEYAPAQDLDYDSAGEQRLADSLLELLTDATRIRLRADVPVGAYLSGGLDSSIITALVRQFTDIPLRTFSVIFDDPEFDESAFQRQVSAFLRVERQEVRCTYDDIGDIFPQVVWQTEKPILRTAPSPLFMLSRLVRENGFKVVLTGEGADEMLGGYDIFKEAKIRRFWGARLDSRRRPLLLKKLYPYLPNLQIQSPEYLKAFFRVRQEDLSSPFFSHLPRWELTAKLKHFFSADVKRELRSQNAYAELQACLPQSYSQWHTFCQAQYLETMFLLPGYILSSQGDRMAMAHSIEGRFPFLDHRVVQLAASIPPRLKMKALNEKYILKRCAKRLVPDCVTERPKQPYRAPEGKSFFRGARGLDYVEAALSPEHIRRTGLFDSAAVCALVNKFREGRAIGIKDNMALTGIVSTQLIADQFVDRLGVAH